MDDPRYLTFLVIFEPKGSVETKGRITAGINAAAATGRLIRRIGPMLRELPRS